MASLFDAQWAPNAVRADQERERQEAAELANVNARRQAMPQSDKSTPSDVYVNALINSGNTQAMQRGLDMRERLMEERRNARPAAARNLQITKVGDRNYIVNPDGSTRPLVSDQIYRQNNPLPVEEAGPDDLMGNNARAGQFRAYRDPNTPEDLRRMIRADLQRDKYLPGPNGTTIKVPGMTDYDLGIAAEPDRQETVIEKGMSEKGKDLDRVLRSAEMSANRYKSLLMQYGSEGIPGVGRDKLQQAYNDLKLKLKEGYALGVLSGGDEVILEKVLPDPTAWYNQLKSGDRLIESFESTIEQNLKSDREIWESQYGGNTRNARPKQNVNQDGWGEVSYE